MIALRCRNCGGRDCNWSNQPITLTYYCLHESRSIGIVLKCRSDLADGIVDSLIGIDENVFAPELFNDFFPSNQLTPPLEQQDQQLKRLLLQSDALPRTPQFKA